ncbi:MAG: hypothetical protein VW362_07605 [Candidatus Nanopelagicales bacterium]
MSDPEPQELVADPVLTREFLLDLASYLGNAIVSAARAVVEGDTYERFDWMDYEESRMREKYVEGGDGE